MKDIDKDFISETVAKNLKGLRKKLDLTQDELAEILGVRLSIVACIEVGRRDIHVLELYKLASRLNVNVNAFLGLNDEIFDPKTLKHHLKNIQKSDLRKEKFRKPRVIQSNGIQSGVQENQTPEK